MTGALAGGLPGWFVVAWLGALATAGWGVLGWPIAHRLPLPAACTAPLLGWAIHLPVAALVLPSIGLSWGSVVAVWLAVAAAVWLTAWRHPALPQPRVPPWLAALAGGLALLAAAAVMPKPAGVGVRFAAAMFDHSKIVLVDGMLRQGLPPAQVMYGGADVPGGAIYYYWWHLAAAELARAGGLAGGAAGWAGDAALTWFTAAATLLLIGGMALAIAGRAAAGIALLLSLPGSLRAWLGWAERAGWIAPGHGMGGWLNQASWAPQHLAAGGCLVLAGLLLAALAEGGGLLIAAALAGVVACGVGCSVWVGGVTAAVALPAGVLALLVLGQVGSRTRLLALAGGGGLAGVALALPLVRLLASATALRHGSAPIRLAAYPVLGAALPHWLNLPAWPLLPLIEFPALAILSAAGIALAARAGLARWQLATLAIAGAGLAVSATLRSTIDNNDLGWRAVVPALLVAAPYAALAVRRLAPRAAALCLVPAALGLPGAAALVADNLAGQDFHHPGAAAAFAAGADGFAALRAASAPADRVASDPLLAAGLTAWPIDIAWALLADRPSCYAGWALAHSFAPVPTAALYATDQQVRRVFDGTPQPGETRDLARRLRCRFALLTPQSPAWRTDPFATDPAWRSIAATPAYRLYAATPATDTPTLTLDKP